MSSLPPIRSKHRICVICEGYEDYHYFKRLMDLNVWDCAYSFTLINVKSASNIPARFQGSSANSGVSPIEGNCKCSFHYFPRQFLLFR